MINKKIFVASLLVLLMSQKILASLSVHPAEIRDSLISGKIYYKEIHITNVGPASTLSYSLSSDVLWITFDKISGSINIGDTVKIVAAIDTKNLTWGNYTPKIFIGDPHHGPITINLTLSVSGLTDVNDEVSLPTLPKLYQNLPNPFNPSSKIIYSIPETQKVMLKVFNLLGNELLTLVDNEKPRGTYSISVDMKGFPSGVYFYRLQAGKFTETRKMILTK